MNLLFELRTIFNFITMYLKACIQENNSGKENDKHLLIERKTMEIY